MKIDPYVHAALLLYGAGKEINYNNLKNVLSASGIEVDDAKIKVLVDALKDVNIDEAVSKAVSAPVVTTPVTTEQTKEVKEEKKEEKKEDDGAAGLAALFG